MVKMRRGWLRMVGLGAITACFILYIFLYKPSDQKLVENDSHAAPSKRLSKKSSKKVEAIDLQVAGKGQQIPHKQCLIIQAPKTTIDTVKEFPKFDFQPAWMRAKEFWDTKFEKRYLLRRTKWSKHPLKVILLPHSHNDPGWLKTLEEYYFHHTSHILTNIVEKLKVNTNMTFVWSEVVYLSFWYDRAHPKLREQMKALVKSGRLEIVTGGWVMTDEANAHIYAMTDQLIEGHQWVYDTFGIKPEHGWSIDVFGHGAAVPYLLKESGIDGSVIQRLHYSWKQWLAEKQYGDFLWRQNWDSSGESDMLIHNRPYDIYSIKHSCGPHPQICLNYDFRKVIGEYTEYSIKAVNVNEKNVKAKAELLLDQYGKTGSLYPHNVVLVPIGDDFRYNHAAEVDQQYKNYQLLLDYINNNSSYYHATLQWGTLKDYFKEVKKRTKSFPTLKGDFFVYSDIFSDGRPAYWSGYYTTRPFLKILDRQLEGVLHSAEVLYTWAWNRFSHNEEFRKISQILEKDFEKLVKARRNLGVFQHHDAITGTSKSYVMHDYAIKLHEGIQDAYNVLSHSAFALISTDGNLLRLKHDSFSKDFLQSIYERASYDKLPKTIPINMSSSQKLIVMVNSLGQRRYEVVKLIVTSLNLRLTDERGNDVQFQINPIWNATSDGMVVVSSQYEMFFIADLAPLSLITYTLHQMTSEISSDHFSSIFTNYLGSTNDASATPFTTKDILFGDIQLESDRLKLVFDGSTGLLRSVMDKATGKISQLMMQYAAYPSAQFNSGAYLFQPDRHTRDSEDDVLSGAKPRIFIQSGPLISEFTVMFGGVLMHTVRIFHSTMEPLASAIYMENAFNLGGTYDANETPGFTSQFRETELFLRFKTDISNGDEPIFYTDQSGLSMQKRVHVESIGIEGNYFPITSAAYLEDSVDEPKRRRMTLLVDHAAGAASWKEGWLEVMIERRTFYDDARGMGEGVTDQKRTIGKYWLLIEHSLSPEEVPRLSLAAHYLSNSLNFPSHTLVMDGLPSDSLKAAAHLISRPFPCNLHLLHLRAMPEAQYPFMTPSRRALLTLQHQSPACSISSAVSSCRGISDSLVQHTNLTIPVKSIEETELTGLTVLKDLASLSELLVPHHRIRSAMLTF